MRRCTWSSRCLLPSAASLSVICEVSAACRVHDVVVYRVTAPSQGALWTVIKTSEPLSEQQPCLKNRRNLPATRPANHADSGRIVGKPYLGLCQGCPSAIPNQ